jgi:hypothetical protein
MNIFGNNFFILGNTCAKKACISTRMHAECSIYMSIRIPTRHKLSESWVAETKRIIHRRRWRVISQKDGGNYPKNSQLNMSDLPVIKPA